MQYHLKICDAVKTRLFLHHEMMKQKSSEKHFRAPPIDQTENWDDDNVKTYDSSEYLAESGVIRLAQNKIPSERKNFKANECGRLAALRQNWQSSALDRGTLVSILEQKLSVIL